MEIIEAYLKDVCCVLRPIGRLDSEHSPALEEAVRTFFDRGGGNLLIDMSEVPYISSRGLRVFLISAKIAESKGNRLAVCSLQEFVTRAFMVTSFDVLIPMLDSSDDAIEYFSGAGGANAQPG